MLNFDQIVLFIVYITITILGAIIACLALPKLSAYTCVPGMVIVGIFHTVHEIVLVP